MICSYLLHNRNYDLTFNVSIHYIFMSYLVNVGFGYGIYGHKDIGKANCNYRKMFGNIYFDDYSSQSFILEVRVLRIFSMTQTGIEYKGGWGRSKMVEPIPISLLERSLTLRSIFLRGAPIFSTPTHF